jgi:predicted aspartyl protease
VLRLRPLRRRRARLVTGQAASLCLAAALLAGCSDNWTDGSGASSPSAGDGREVPVQVVQQDGQTMVLLQVTIRDTGPYLFVLDTGASTSAVDDDIAQRLRLPRTGERRQVSGVLGSDKVPLVRLRDWQAGKVRLQSAEATVIDLDANARARRIHGLLGSDVLNDFGSITLDYRQQVLRLPPA